MQNLKPPASLCSWSGQFVSYLVANPEDRFSRDVAQISQPSSGTSGRIVEPQHDKTNKMTCASSEDSDQPGCPPRLIRVFAVRSMGSQGPNVSSCGQRRLISLGGCPGWSESSLGAHVILLDLSYCGSVKLEPTNLDTRADEQHSDQLPFLLNFTKYHMSHVMRKPVLAIGEQQRCRSACASAQSGQHLCCSLLR